MGGDGQSSYPTSPWVVAFPDYQMNAITISVSFVPSTHALISGTITRDPGCVYSRILLGIGPDGTPDTSPNQFTVRVGTTNFSPAQMAKVGFNTMDDFLGLQITAGT